MERKLVMRADKVAFMKVAETLHRMRGFKSLPTNKNPIEYTRQYVDEYFETTDVIGMSESKDFEFDQYVNDPVHDELVKIFKDELLGGDAVVTIVTIDKNADGENGVSRDYSVVPDTEGDGTEGYTFAGRFTALTKPEKGTYTISEDGLTAEQTGGV